MPSVLETLGDLDELEHLLRNATQPGQLAEVDLDQARDLLGDDAARSLERLQELAKMLEEAGLIEQREGRYELTPKGVRALGQKALGDLFRKLLKDRAGRHEIERTGVGHERAYEHKPYEFGDPFHLNVRADGQERDLAPGRRARRCGSRPTTSRSSAPRSLTRSATVLHARRVALDADARQLPAGEEGRDGAARAHHHAVPARLLRAGGVRSRRARGEAASCCPR